MDFTVVPSRAAVNRIKRPTSQGAEARNLASSPVGSLGSSLKFDSTTLANRSRTSRPRGDWDTAREARRRSFGNRIHARRRYARYDSRLQDVDVRGSARHVLRRVERTCRRWRHAGRGRPGLAWQRCRQRRSQAGIDAHCLHAGPLRGGPGVGPGHIGTGWEVLDVVVHVLARR